MFENDITKIVFFNYKLKSAPVQVSRYKQLFWLEDVVKELPDNRYKCSIILQSIEQYALNNVPVEIIFEDARIERT